MSSSTRQLGVWYRYWNFCEQSIPRQSLYVVDCTLFASHSHLLWTGGWWWWEGGNKPASLITSAVCFTYDVPIGRQYGARPVSVARAATCKLRRLFPSSFFICSRFFLLFPDYRTHRRATSRQSRRHLYGSSFTKRHLLIRQFVLRYYWNIALLLRFTIVIVIIRFDSQVHRPSGTVFMSFLSFPLVCFAPHKSRSSGDV